MFGYALTSLMIEDAMQSWGWRVPFLFGALIGLVGFYIRHHVSELPEFLRVQAERTQGRPPAAPLSMSAVVCAIGVVAVDTALNYLWHSYAPTYAVREMHLPLSVALGATTVAGVVAIVCYPISG